MAMLKHAPETDLAIVDGSPGIGCPVISSVSGMDLVLVVAEPSRSGLSDLERLVKTRRNLPDKAGRLRQQMGCESRIYQGHPGILREKRDPLCRNRSL